MASTASVFRAPGGVVASALLALSLAGCGATPEVPVPIKGKLVNAAGKPLANMVLTFHPQEEVNKGRMCMPVTDKEGRFSDTCIRGRYKVTLAAIPKQYRVVPGPGGIVASPAGGRSMSSIPASYRSPQATPLVVEVPPGGKQNIVLTVR